MFDGNKRRFSNISFDATFISEGVYPVTELSVDGYDPCIAVMQRAFDGEDVFMVMNTDDVPHSLNIRINAREGDKLFAVDLLTEERTELEYRLSEGRAQLEVSLPPLEQVIISRCTI